MKAIKTGETIDLNPLIYSARERLEKLLDNSWLDKETKRSVRGQIIWGLKNKQPNEILKKLEEYTKDVLKIIQNNKMNYGVS